MKKFEGLVSKQELKTTELGEQARRMLNQFHDAEVKRYEEGGAPEILKSIEKGEVSKEELTRVVSVRYEAAHFFEDMLRRLIQRIEESKTLSPSAKQKLKDSVQTNLDEELGKVKEYGGPHLEGRADLLRALGINYESWEKKLGTYKQLGDLHPSARNLIGSLKKIVDEDPIIGVAALYYYEDRIPLDGMDHVGGDYVKLLRGFKKIYAYDKRFTKEKYEEGDALWHLYSHAEHDTHHAELAKDALLAAVRSEGDLKKVQHGMTSAKEVIDRFWKEVIET